MLSALIIALREGVEAALVVGIVLVYLNRTGRRALKVYAWVGLALAVAASVAAAILLQRWRFSEDGFEGLLMLVAAALVVTMIIWMNKVARSLRKEIEERIEAYAHRAGRAAGWGIGAFVFLMVVREGAELVLILRGVEFSSSGVQTWIGTVLGVAIAAAVGIFFFQGTLRIPLRRFFSATSIILFVIAFQLALTGLHELSEAVRANGTTWIPSSRAEMALIGPIVNNETFFFIVVLGVAALAVLREWFDAKRPAADPSVNPAERRMREWEFRRQRRWSFAATGLCVLVVLALAADSAYAWAAAKQPPAQGLVAQGSEVHIPLSNLTGATLHFYTTDVQGTEIRFMVIHKPDGDYTTALDACQICGAIGYRQDGHGNVVCRNCGAPLDAASIGQPGGCNPIPVKSRVAAGEVVVDLSALTGAASTIHPN